MQFGKQLNKGVRLSNHNCPSPRRQGVDQGALWRSLDKVRDFLVEQLSWMFVDRPQRLKKCGEIVGCMVVKVTNLIMTQTT